MAPSGEDAMSKGTTPADWVARPVHHLLIAGYPVLFLLANNMAEVDPREGLVPTIVAVGSAAVLFVLLRLARVPSRRAALIISVLAIVVLMYGHVAGAPALIGVSGLPLLVAWLVVGIGACIGILLIPGDLRTMTGLLNAVSALLVAVSLAPIVSHLGTDSTVYAGGQWLPTPSGAGSSAAEPGGGGPMRDIYYLVVEDYGGPRALADYLDLPHSNLFDWLAEEGFTVLEDARSNYGRTPLSLASSLNMTYLDEVAEQMGPDDPSHRPYEQMVTNPQVVRFLKERGYSYVLLGSQYYLTDTSPQADLNPTFAQSSDFEAMLISLTILPPIADRLGFEDELSDRRRIYDAAIWDIETFPRLTDLPGPKFVFFHLYLPHSPWVVDAEGRYVTDADDRERAEYEQQVTQWDFVSREMKTLIEGLLDEPEETAPIIILTTDEGPNPADMVTSGPDIVWSKATDEQLDQKFTIFAAYRLPGVNETCLYPGMSSVNTFRVVLDLYFDAGLPLLPDRNYSHRDKSHPSDLTEITDRLPPSSAGSDTDRACPP
jgi:hypothetical protein